MFNPREAKKRMKEITGKDFSFNYEGLSEKEIKELEKNSNFSSGENKFDDEKIEIWGKANPLGVTTSFRHTKNGKIYEETSSYDPRKIDNDSDNSLLTITEIGETETEEDLKRKKQEEIKREKNLKQNNDNSTESDSKYHEWLKVGKNSGYITVLLIPLFAISLVLSK